MVAPTLEGAARLGRFHMPDQEIRCCACARLLFKMETGALSGALSVKCPRCRAFNLLRPSLSPNPERHPRQISSEPQ